MFNQFPSLARKISFSLFFVVIFAIIWRVGFANLDPDLGWHLKFGQDISQNHQLPHDQIHLWSINGSWVDHEWLSNWLMFLIYHKTGYIGLTFVFALISAWALWLVAKNLRQQTWSSDIFVAGLTSLGLAGILPHLGPRPQQISFLFLALELLILKKISQKPNWRSAFGLLIFFWFWACLHGGFVVGLAVLGLWSAQKILTAIKNHQTKKGLFPFLTGLGCLIATLITPYGLKLYDFLFTYQNNAYLKHISEWKAVWVFPIHYWQLLFMALVIALAIIVLIFKTKIKDDLWLWLSVVLFLLMSFKSVRHFPLFFVVASLTIVPEFIKTNFKKISTYKKTALTTSIEFFAIGCLLGLAWLSLFSINFLRDPWRKFCADYPCQTVQVLKNDPQYSQLKLLNKYDYGGWLIWVWPEKKLFIDGRLPQYPLGKWSLLEEYLEFDNPDKIAEKLKTYDIEMVLWGNHLATYKLNWLDKLLGFKEAEINNRSDELKKYLSHSPDWRRVFFDEASTVFIRQDKL